MDDLQKLFANLKARGVSTFAAEVLEVDKESGTCTVVDDGIEYYNVQLSSLIDGAKKQLFIYPVIGSSVLVSPIEEKLDWLYVEVYSEVEQVDWNIENVKFSFDKDGFLLKKENETLKKLVVDILKFVKTAERKTSSGVTLGLIEPQKIIADELISRTENLLK
ncbi:hypothetical protein [Epilithonimonas arachidiradicis]|uniref:Uncharacterized protein n=1 Tax=Epilithonimonas arachidiradicis TaxID=1617282 RepID=A0A420DDY4_9FLAO|nr:hypothetical protein [Epilithonimonas arachidiradicis]RKE90002.1 hypothetical protein BXY58_0587 [Epilithonimonas arachidiradicis]GGG47004.1 hypothetical protein GCM10007332_05620 [Epilithonimonas arachidiradicis]